MVGDRWVVRLERVCFFGRVKWDWDGLETGFFLRVEEVYRLQCRGSGCGFLLGDESGLSGPGKS